MIKKYLKDKDFLKKFDNQIIKNQYVKIIVLDFLENPIDEVQGKVTGGSINLDGASSMRRTCNLGFSTDSKDLKNLKSLLGINRKVKIEIGFDNLIDDRYDSIVWFPMGLFVIFNPSFNFSNSGLDISVQLKDKMCLLNGEVGGTLPATVIFNEIETIGENNQTIITHPTVYQIIKEVVNHFGEEQLGKIIISDIDLKIKQVMKWTGTNPLYELSYSSNIDNIVQKEFFTNETTLNSRNAELVAAGYDCTITTFKTGMDVGFIYTDFTYPGELTGNAGDTVCTILDKIISTLGNYEYFYDTDGNFIFQEIKNYLNTSQAKVEMDKMKNSDYLVDFSRSKSEYSFEDNFLINSYSNTPNFGNIKNDFLIWGIRKDSNENTYPIRYHLAIDKKPKPELVGEDWRNVLYRQGIAADPFGAASNYYYTELKNEWTKIYDTTNLEFKEEYLKNPSEADFFLDFIDADAAISEYSVWNIGRRTKVIVDNDVNCIFAPDIPDLVLIEIGTPITDIEVAECEARGQKYYKMESEMFSLLSMGGSLKSAFSVVKDLLFQYTNYNESISLTGVPVYHLEPNIRISVSNEECSIYGDYIIQSISLPFDCSGTMTINANRALERI